MQGSWLSVPAALQRPDRLWTRNEVLVGTSILSRRGAHLPSSRLNATPLRGGFCTWRCGLPALFIAALTGIVRRS